MDNPPPLSPLNTLPPQKKQGCGCFGIGCIIVLLLLLVCGGIGIWMGMSLVNYLKTFTSDKPMEIPVVQATDAEYQAVVAKVNAFKHAANTGQSSTVQLTDREINIMIARDPEFSELRGRAYVEILNGSMHAKVSYPLDQIPMFKGRYFNGDVKFRLSVQDDVGRLIAEEIRVGEQTAPTEFLKSLEDGFNRSINEDPDNKKVFERIKNLQIEGNSILIETKPGPAALPQSASTP